MKPVYLRHPKHGSKVTTSEFELEHDKALGWEVYDPTVSTKEPAGSPAVVQPAQEPVGLVQAPAWLTPQPEEPKRKGGRPKKFTE